VKFFVEFLVLGLVTGSVSSLLAVAMVVAYRGSRVINFSQGAVAMVGTYVFYSCHVTHDQSFIVSFVAGVGTSALLSMALQILVLQRLRNAPQITKIIVTIAFLELLNQWETIRSNPNPLFLPPDLPTRPVSAFGISVPSGQLMLLGIVIAIAVAVGLVYRYTQLGRATAAALDNRRALSALGYSPSRVEAINWLLSGALAGVAGILLAPISGLSVVGYSVLVLPALAAAVLGRFTSITWAVVGGLLIGAIQSEMTWYIHTPGWSDAAPFLLLMVVLAVRGIGAVWRSAPSQRLPRVGNGLIKPKILIPIAAVLLVITNVVNNPLWLSAIAITAGSAIILMSFVVITGYSGQLSLAQFAFAGLGAFFAGKLIEAGHMALLPAVAIGVVAVAPLGVILGLVCLRASGMSLAILTLGFAAATEYLIFENSSLTGDSGILIGTTKLFGINMSAISSPNDYATMAIIMMLLTGLVVANVRRGVAGRRLLAMRANERAATSLGIDVVGAKLFAFTIGSMIAALGGIIVLFCSSSVEFNQFSTIPSAEAVSQAILGGVGWIPGAVMGGFIQTTGVLSQAIDVWVGSGAVAYVPLVSALFVMIVISKQPDGGAPLMAAQLKWIGSKLAFWKSKSAPESKRSVKVEVLSDEDAEVRVSPMTLRVKGLTVRFGGTIAVDGLDLEVNPGEIVGLIGPNGAGKSTAIDAITGYVPCEADSIVLDEVNLANLNASKRARAGIRRSFQSLELFDDLTILDNLAAATDPIGSKHFLMSVIKPRGLTINPVTSKAIEAFKLTDVLDLNPGELSYGTRRLLAIARAAASGPSILMLDEPAAGLDDSERAELVEVLQLLVREWGMGILLVEHDVPMVMRTCDRIYVLDLGKLIAMGAPAEVVENPRVISAFLGSSETKENA
jgi:ABC-type branched-subunit amino acid transport system ATPase component/ABC-type branched-subunit amino acid transport system permease subunit